MKVVVGSLAATGFALVALAFTNGCSGDINAGYSVPVDVPTTYEAGPGLQSTGGAGHCAAPPNAPRGRGVDAAVCDPSAGVARAEVVDAKVLVLTAALDDTGNVSTAEGTTLTALTANVSGVGTTGTVVATASSTAGEGAYAKASVEHLNLSVLGIGIKADAVVAEASSACGEPTGKTTIANLTAAGQPVSIGAAGSVDVAGLLRIAIDERTQNADGTGIVVRALHVTALSGSAVDLTVGFASADGPATCGCSSKPRDVDAGVDAGTDAGDRDAGPSGCYDSSDCPEGLVCIPDGIFE